ncbi:MAG: DMT family transporter [Rhodospirillales bacterium]|nr:DMT family transporter [Rhodospirillales bacterium]
MSTLPTRSQPMKGILFMVGWAFVVTVQDAAIKWVAPHYPPGEIIFLRALITLLTLLPFVARAGGLQALRTRRIGTHAIRAALFMVSMVFFILSVRVMPLVDAVTLTFTGPLFVTALAVPMLAENVGWRRWMAVTAGFIGVVVMLRPTEAALNVAVVLPVASAFACAIRDVLTRKMTFTETSVAIVFHSNLGVCILGLATIPFGWTMPTPEHVGLLVFTGSILALSEYLIVQAFRFGEVSVVMPFKYSSVVWAVVLGYWMWADVPDAYTAVGAAFVIGSGLYVLHREALRKGLRDSR